RWAPRWWPSCARVARTRSSTRSRRPAEVTSAGRTVPGTADLAGRGIVITRPRERAAELAALVKAAGGRPIGFPAITIVDVPESRELRALIDRLDAFDVAVFVSPTAASRALALIRRRRALPEKLALAAVGKGTARELERLGATALLVPPA